MPKIKTHKSSAKRFKRRGSGSLKRRNAYATHFLAKKTTKRKRAFRKSESIAQANSASIRRALCMK